MITLTKEFRRALAANDRNYDARAVIVLEDTTRIELEGDEIWSDGFAIEDAVSDDEAFTALGSTVINAATLIIDNTKDKYIEYNFNNADVTLFITKTFGERTEVVKMGTYRVDDTKYDEATITLSMLDMMEQFDRPYVPISYPASLEAIVRDACAVCLGTASKLATQTFPHSQFVIDDAPTDEACTYREVISWCATIAGCFARCNRDGELEIKWFNTAALEDSSGTDGGEFDSTTGSYYQTGDTADGGTFSPWSTGAEVDGGNFTDAIPLHYIGSLYSQTICVDETVITGVQIEVEDPDPQAEVKTETYTEGQAGYIIQVSKNPFITKDNVEDILEWLADELIGLRFRKCNVTHADDPSIEAGDVALLYDSRQREYPILITRHAFEIGGPQTIVCGCETPARNQATRYTAVTKAYVENRKQLKQQVNAYEEALRELAEDIEENAHGLYADEITDPDDPNASIYCLHDKPLIADSNIQIRLSTVGIVVTRNGTAQNPTWYGLQVNGNIIANIMQTIGINFDWGTGGTLKLGGTGYGDGKIEVYDSDNAMVGAWDKYKFFIKTKAFNTQYNRYIDLKFSGVEKTSTGSFLHKIGYFFILSEGSGYTLHGGANGFFAWGNDDFKMLRIGVTTDQVTENDQVGAYVAAHYQGGSFLARSHGIGNDDNGFAADYGTQPLFAGMHTLCDGSEEYFYAKSILNQKLITRFTGRIVSGITTSYPEYGRTEIGLTRISANSGLIPFFRLKAKKDNDVAELVGYPSNLMYNGNTIAYTSSSSIRYKHDIKPIEDKTLDPHKLLALPLVQFKWNDNHSLQYADMAGQTIPGIIAEDVEKIYPSATIHKDGKVESWDERRIIPGMLALIQEQDKIIKEQQARLDELEKKLESLTRVVEAYTMKL